MSDTNKDYWNWGTTLLAKGAEMRANCSIWTIVLLLLLSAGSVASAQDAMPWATDIESAKQLAAQKNQLVMVHFWAPNCPPCRMLDATLFRDPQFAAAIAQDYVPVKVNAAEETAIASKYGVDRWPQDVIILPSGQMIYRMVSRQEKDKDQYLSMLHGVAVKAAGMTQLASTSSTPDARPVSYPGEAPAAGSGYSRFGAPPAATETAAAPATESRFSTQPPASSYGQNNAAAPSAAPTQSRFAAQPPAADYSQNAAPAASPATTQSRFSTGGYGDMNNAAPAAAAASQTPQQPSGYAAGGPAPAGQPTAPTATQSRFAAQPSGSTYGQPSPMQQPPVQPTPQAQSRFASQPAAAPATTSQFASQPKPQPQIEAQPAGQSVAPTPQAPQQKPEFALDGFCPVTLAEKGNWQKGDARWGAVHQGKVYLFASAAEQRMFLASPDRFSPVLSGNDPVAYIDQGRLVDGNRSHGLTYNGVLYLFSSEQNLESFWASPQRYAAQVQQAMLRNSQQLR
ncbi:thioredoxin domain-containing protein [Blastopirellula marina]|uniref:Thioredoxin domain-containing protein n=1 Tax=Blastopirellula marina TaxID=124 RepID=A0A2S8GJQ5_9BACT|nr:thioredoxin domain-containing protein [Blastopirellula marina]PQO44656.1 hypothetical protein C5Y93_17970 [Blastopirellula marina]